MFFKATPVWPADSGEMNTFARFEVSVCLQNAVLYIAAADFYRVRVNGRFVAHGPARAAKGYARVDALSLDAFASGADDTLSVEVAGYRCRSFSTCAVQPFLCAELRCNEQVIAYTGQDFSGWISHQKVQKTHRYSVQRHFTEVWDYTAAPDTRAALISASEDLHFLPRVAPYPHYEDIPARPVCQGVFTNDGPGQGDVLYCSWLKIPEVWGCFPQEELARDPLAFLSKQKMRSLCHGGVLPLTIQEGQYVLMKLPHLECGFLYFDAETEAETDLILGFSEFCENETFSFFNAEETRNVIECVLPPGHTERFLSFEPYTAQYVVLMVKKGSLRLSGLGVKTYARDMAGAAVRKFRTEAHQKIYDAALRTFSHNAIDIFTDCPSRERAGWLCDSYFSAIVEHYLFGKVPTEEAFLENFLQWQPQGLPSGALPMCYPADVLDTGTKELLYKPYDDSTGLHIPQWCLWFVLEVFEYLTVRTDGSRKELFREKVMGVMQYLSAYENEDGLLERLPSWNFVEWSKANDWTWDVNYPTNFLYSEALMAVYALYGEDAFREKAMHIRRVATEKSFNGKYFTDNAVRDENGVLCNTGNASEACQYYALLFGGVNLDDNTYALFRQDIANGFARWKTDGNFVPVNAFIGFYLRLKYLLQQKQYALVMQEAAQFCGNMAEKTGTLWEYSQGCGSLDHGFASYVAYAMCVALDHL